MPLTRAQKRKQQKAVERRKATKRLLRQEAQRPSLNAASRWPWHRLMISAAWKDPMRLTQVFMARRGPEGWYAVGLILLDRACLGAKNAFGRVVDEAEYLAIWHRISQTEPFVEATPELAAKLVRESVRYAEKLGFRPHSDLAQALKVLGPADPDACAEDIPVGGPDGKPFFVAGPYDNVPHIMAKLEAAFGRDNFYFLMPVSPDEINEDSP